MLGLRGEHSHTLLLCSECICSLRIEIGGRFVLLRPASEEAEASRSALEGFVCLADSDNSSVT